MRAAGTHVALVDGALAAYLGRASARSRVPAGGRAAPHGGARLAFALAPGRRGRASALGWAIVAAARWRSLLAPFLLEAGFMPSGPGFRLASTNPIDESDEETDLAAPDDI